MNADRFSFQLRWSDEDGGYIATSPEFVGVSAFGLTAESALQEARIALEAAIEIMLVDGKVIPQPLGIPSFSGQFRLRIPPTLHRQLVERSEWEGVSLNHLCSVILAQGVVVSETNSVRTRRAS